MWSQLKFASKPYSIITEPELATAWVPTKAVVLAGWGATGEQENKGEKKKEGRNKEKNEKEWGREDSKGRSQSSLVQKLGTYDMAKSWKVSFVAAAVSEELAGN